MKGLQLSLLFLALFFTACSVNLDIAGDEPDGNWAEMNLSSKEVHFDHKGGLETVYVRNYNSWWISSACNEKCADSNYILPVSLDSGLTNNRFISGGWWNAEVPKGKSSTLNITANAAETRLSEDCGKEVFPRKAIIIMTAGDIFESITIYQE